MSCVLVTCSSRFGCVVVKRESRGMSQRAAKLGGATTLSVQALSRVRAMSTAAAKFARPSRTRGSIASPSGVSSSARVSRRKSAAPR
jgi:hypothetical protein